MFFEVADPRFVGPGHSILADLCSTQPEVVRASTDQFVSCIANHCSGAALHDHFTKVLSQTEPRARAWLRGRSLNYEAVLSTIAVPVLITHGSDDPIVLSGLAETLQKLLPDGTGTVSIFQNAGHAVFLDDPDRFNRELATFADQCTSQLARSR